MMQDLIVEEVAKELIFLGETVLQVSTKQRQTRGGGLKTHVRNRSGKEGKRDLYPGHILVWGRGTRIYQRIRLPSICI